MYIYTHIKTNRVVFFSHELTSVGSAFEGIKVKLNRAFPAVPANFNNDTCFNWRLDAGKLVMAEVTEPTIDPDVLLVNQQLIMIQRINSLCGNVRYPLMKLILGQEKVYELKASQARAFLAGVTIDKLPFLNDEVAVQGRDPTVIAHEIVRVDDTRTTVLSASERARRILTTKVCSASTVAELTQIAPLITTKNFTIPMPV